MFHMKQIKVTCTAAGYVDPHKLKIIQGELKSLSKANYNKLRLSIEKHGHSFATHVWKNGEGELCVLDGTQRTRVTLREVDEGRWSCPQVPVNYVTAKSFKDAVQKLIAGAGSYGKAEGQGLYELMHHAGLSLPDLDYMQLPGLDTRAFEKEFFLDATPEPEDTLPTVGDVTVQVGDVWECGVHRVVCGDATNPEVIARLLDGDKTKPSWVCIDPIYGELGKGTASVDIAQQVCQNPFACFVFGSDMDLFHLARKYPDGLRRLFIFQYDIGLGGMGAYVMHANIGVMFGSHKRFINLRDGFGSVLRPEARRCNNAEQFKSGQVKPVALIEALVSHYSNAGDVCLDLYSGFGTTMLACERYGRSCRSVDLNPKRVQASILRWQAFTSKQAARLEHKGIRIPRPYDV